MKSQRLKSKHFSTLTLNQLRPSQFNKGFTLIELIVVIIVIGILAITVLPKFFNSKGFEEYTYQAQVVSTLRAIQQKAMQQTEVLATNCHQVIITATKLADNCDKSIVQVENNHSVIFSSSNNSFTFDDNGKPEAIATAIDITITGTSALKVRIESEGYIHAL